MDKLKDNFFIGLGAAIVLAIAFYFILKASIPTNFGNAKTIYLFALVPGLILFRIFTVNFQKPKIGRGLLLITILGVILTFIFIR